MKHQVHYSDSKWWIVVVIFDRYILYNTFVFLFTDVPPLADSVFLELSGLDRNLPLHLHLCCAGLRLPGVYVCGHIQAPAASHSAAHAVPGAAGLPQGMLNIYMSKFSRVVYNN